MALGENQNKIQYTVTTSDDSFEFPYKYWDSSEIVVTKLASGIETNPAFTISPTNGDSENGGTVTLDSAVTSCTITIERIVAYASEADYQRGALSPTSLTENFDKAAAMSQQLEDRISRSLNVPTTDPAGLTYDIGTVEVRKNTVLGFDANGNTSNIDLVESGTVGVDTDAGLTIASNIISVNADKLPSGKTFFGFIQNSALASICIDICKIYEQEKGYELNSINGVINSLQSAQAKTLDENELSRFLRKYETSISSDCHICALKFATRTFYKKHSRDLARFKQHRNKQAAHSEYGIAPKDLPSYDVMEKLFIFGADLHNLVSSVFVGAGVVDLNESPTKRSFLLLLQKLGLENIETDMD